MAMAPVGVKGFMKENKPRFSKCPKCGGQIPTDVIVCRHCGVNINSLYTVDQLNYLNNRTKSEKFKDYLDNMSASTIKAIAFFVLLAGLIVYWVGMLLF